VNENPNVTDHRHRHVLDVLPWYANCTLDEDETARVEAHLADCALCRDELEFEQALVADLPRPVGAPGAEAGWATMRSRVNDGSSDSAASGTLTAFRRPSMLRRPVPLGWALIAQAAAIILVVGIGRVMPVNTAQTKQYHTLSSLVTPGSGNALVMFRSDLREWDLRRILRINRAELTGGPNVNGAYQVRVDPKTRDTVLARMRGDAGVTLAQPIDQGGQ
jgi:hypothetical protein